MRYNFARTSLVFCEIYTQCCVVAAARIHAFSATSTANAPLDTSTRPRRERTVESKVEQMDARYARGRTALVRRRERFYGPETVRWAFLALCLLIFQFLFY